MKHKLEMPLEQFAEAVAKENARLTECLKAANENHEHFEREWYLAKDRIETLEAALRSFVDPCLEHCFEHCESDHDPMNQCLCFKARKTLEGKDD